MTIMQIRRGTTAEWATSNPVLASGEEGLDTTLKATKIGDGATAWSGLPFQNLVVSNGVNIIPLDLSANAHGGWAVDTVNTPPGSAKAFSTTVNRNIGVANSTGFIPLDENRIYRYSFDIHSSIVGMKSYLSGNWKTKANVLIGASPYIRLNNTTIPDTWSTFSGFIGPGMDVVPPAGTAGLCPLIYANHANGTQGGTLTIADFRIMDVTEVVDLVRGSLHISTQALNGIMSNVDKGKLDRLVIDVKAYAPLGDGVTSENTQVLAAAAEAYATDTTLYWPKGTWLITANIPNFHLIKHAGPGAIKRGSDTFYPDPSGIKANTLYVSTSGASDTYDGISSAFPMRTTNKAVSVLPNYGPKLQGFWAIQVAAATYTDRTIVPEGLDSVAPITIRGPIVNHPNVPTLKFTEGYNVGAVTFKIVDVPARFIFSNILWEGYNGTASSAGVQLSNSGEASVINGHFTDCYWGVTGQKSSYDIKGGIYTRCGFLGDTTIATAPAIRNGTGGAWRSLMRTIHSIGVQNAGVLTQGPFVYGCYSGLFAQEVSSGHADFVTFEDCINGLSVNVNSRVNCDGSSFKRNTTDIRANGNSHVYLSGNVVFGTGVDESSNKVATSGGAQVVEDNRFFTNISTSYNSVEKIIDTVFPNQAVSTTALTTVYTATLAATIWRNALTSIVKPRRLRLKIFGDFVGTAGTKSIVVRLGTSNVTCTFTATEVGVFEAEATLFFTGTATQYMTIRAARHLGANVRIAQAQATNVLTANTNLTVEASVGVATDVVNISAIDLNWG